MVDVVVIWTNGSSFAHHIDSLSPVNGKYLLNYFLFEITCLLSIVTLYDCLLSDTNCSACVNTRIGTNFQCGWCATTSSCRVGEECSMAIITDGQQCPAPTITNFSPQSGPPGGGTTITITGRNLGVTFSDFTANTVTLTRVPNTMFPCTPISEDYVPGATVRCTTNPLPAGSYTLVIDLPRSPGPGQNSSPTNFEVLTPTVSGASPLFGPIAGGTLLTITGTHLNIGNNAVVRVNGISELCTRQ